MAATAAATMLLADACFDVMTTPGGGDLVVSVLLALCVEIPLALICLWIALHASLVIQARVIRLAKHAARAEARAARLRTVATIPDRASSSPH